MNYQDIPEFVENSSDWSSLGTADDKDVVAEAKKLTEAGTPVIAISVSQTYRHVSIVLKGKGNVSTSWGGIEVPLCASLFPTKPEKSFIDNSLNYAYNSAADVEFWAKK